MAFIAGDARRKTSLGRFERCDECHPFRQRYSDSQGIDDRPVRIPRNGVEKTQFAGWLAVIAQAGATGGDGFHEHAADRRNEGLHLLRCQRSGQAVRGDPRPEQALRSVDVAHAGDDALIEQCRLDRRPATLQPGGKIGGIEQRAERIGAEAHQHRMPVDLACHHQVHEAEAAGIVEGDRCPGVGGEQQMIMRLLAIRSVGEDAKPARHAEMGDPHPAVFKQ